MTARLPFAMLLALACLAAPVQAGADMTTAPTPSGPSAPAPELTYVFSFRVELAPPVELGEMDGGRRRFIAITGGKVYGPRLQGVVLAGGGDWQTIMPGGLTHVEARYFLKASDGTAIEVYNAGVRTAEPQVIERLARGEDVDPSLYYFRTSPQFKVSGGAHAWLGRNTFVARAIRRPDHVVIDYYVVG
jgi:hypothetical protein